MLTPDIRRRNLVTLAWMLIAANSLPRPCHLSKYRKDSALGHDFLAPENKLSVIIAL